MFTNFGLDFTQLTTLDNGWTLPIANARALMMCGYCNNPAAYHSDTYLNDDTLMVCDYDFAENGPRPDYDYYLHRSDGLTTDVTLYQDYSGNADNYSILQKGLDYDNEDGTFTNFRIEDDPSAYVNYDEIEYDATTRWVDRNPNEHTSALDWWYVTPTQIMSGAYSEDHPKRAIPQLFDFNADRTAFVEGTAGFISREFIDPNATEHYHNRLLNSFINKRTGKFHVGSIAFDFNGSNVTATCVNRECERKCEDGVYRQAAWTFDRSTISDRAVMEAIVYTVIRHGNNHGPSWLTSRPDFYLMHDFDCDLNHSGIACNHNRVVTDRDITDFNDVEFVMDHQKYCNDSNCKCSEWLASNVPALKEVA